MTGPGVSSAVLVIHAGAGPGSAPNEQSAGEHRSALRESLKRGRAVLEARGDAIDAVQAAIVYMEDAVPFFNAGRGSVLCADGSVEMSAALMRGRDRAAGAVALIRRTRQPIVAAAAVLDRSPHVLLAGDAADAFGAAAGLEQRDPSYFVTERQRARLGEAGTDFTVDLWLTLFAPTGVPNEVLTKLNGALRTALKEPALIAAFAKVGAEPRGSSPEEGTAFIKTEYTKWKDVIKSANIKLN